MRRLVLALAAVVLLGDSCDDAVDGRHLHFVNGCGQHGPAIASESFWYDPAPDDFSVPTKQGSKVTCRDGAVVLVLPDSVR